MLEADSSTDASPRGMGGFGVPFLFALTLAATVGAGIFRTPGLIAGHLTTFRPFIAIWLLGGLYALLCANAVAELAARVPSRAQYVFVRRTFGDLAGFVAGWIEWVAACATIAAITIVIGEYALVLLPSFRAPEVISLLAVTILTVLHWRGVRLPIGAQKAESLLKLLAFVVVVAICLILGGRMPADAALEADSETSPLLAWVVAGSAVIFAYDGWSSVLYVSGALRGKRITRTMFGVIGGVTGLYLLLNLACLRVVPLATMAGETLPLARVARHLFGGTGDELVRWLVIAVLATAAYSNIRIAPRVLFAMSHHDLFWRSARTTNVGGTPDVALLITSFMVAGFVIVASFERALAIAAFLFVALYAMQFVALFAIRRREPAATPPHHAWGHPVTTAVGVAVSVAFLVAALIATPHDSGNALILAASGYPLYLLVRR